MGNGVVTHVQVSPIQPPAHTQIHTRFCHLIYAIPHPGYFPCPCRVHLEINDILSVPT